MKVKIRDFLLGDEDNTYSLIQNVLTDTNAGIWNPPNSNYHCVVAELEEDHSFTLIEDNRPISIFIRSGAILGFASMFILRKVFRAAPVCQIEDVVVDTNVHGNGIGSRLVETLVNRASLLGCYKVILNCNNENISFYEKNGFKPVSTTMRLDI